MIRKIATIVVIVVQVGIVAYYSAVSLHNFHAKRWVQDDAYISFRFAKNMVEGNGLVYNPGQKVEGYTNFLWTLISAIPLYLGHEDPLPFMHQFSAVLWILSYLMLLIAGLRIFRDGIWFAPLASIPLLFHHSFNLWFFSGMETPLVSFFTIAVVFFFTFDQSLHRWPLIMAALSGVGLMMTRPDGVFLVAGVALAGLISYFNRLFNKTGWRRYILMPALPFLLVYVPYTVWRVFYYGSFYPNTYYAKVAYLTHYSRGWTYITYYFKAYPFAPWLILLVLGALLSPQGAIRRFLDGTLFGSLMVFFYILRLGGDFMEWRFVTPVTGLIYPAIIIGASVIAQRCVQWLLLIGKKLSSRIPANPPGFKGLSAGVTGMVAAGVCVFFLTNISLKASLSTRNVIMDGQETIELLSRYCDPDQQYDWGMVGKAFDSVLPENIMIATTSAGIIPFYCDRPCLDLHGLTDPIIARERVDPKARGRVGHEHWLQNYDTMRNRGVDIYLYWADPKAYAMSRARPPESNFEMVSLRLPNKKYVEFAILNASKLDLEKMKAHPDLVFFDRDKFYDKSQVYKFKDQASEQWKLITSYDIGSFENTEDVSFELFDEGDNQIIDHHTKSESYAPPLEDYILEDTGIRIRLGARFTINALPVDRDIVMVIRYDTGRAKYFVDVNGSRLSQLFRPTVNLDLWDEAAISIPRNLLQPDINIIELIKDASDSGNTEMYYVWFFQATEDQSE